MILLSGMSNYEPDWSKSGGIVIVKNAGENRHESDLRRHRGNGESPTESHGNAKRHAAEDSPLATSEGTR
jgi:hypothetical protein